MRRWYQSFASFVQYGDAVQVGPSVQVVTSGAIVQLVRWLNAFKNPTHLEKLGGEIEKFPLGRALAFRDLADLDF